METLEKLDNLIDNLTSYLDEAVTQTLSENHPLNPEGVQSFANTIESLATARATLEITRRPSTVVPAESTSS